MTQPTNPASPSGAGAASGQSQNASKKTYPYRFGEVGIMIGLLKREQVKTSLKRQSELKIQSKEQLIGQIMVECGWISDREVDAILVAQKRFRAEQQKRSGGTQSSSATSRTSPPKSSRKATQQLGSFELLQKLGEGSMGTVYKALDTEKDRVVALKVLSRSLANDAEFLERFRREIKTVEGLNHPNIVAYHGSGSAGGHRYLAMEFVNGESLYMQLKRNGRLQEKEALRIARDIASALDHAHGQALIHRDIKPENVLMARDGAVKVTDFGLAKSQEDTSKLTAVGLSIGTPHYLSPEQAMGAQEVDHRADMYSLGATLYHLLTGQVPFDHQSSTKVMVMHVQEPPPDPRSLQPSVSRGAAKLTLRLMSKAPGDRFAETKDLIATLDGLISGKPVEIAANQAAAASASSGGFMDLLKAPIRLTQSCLGRAGIFLAIIGALSYIIFQ